LPTFKDLFSKQSKNYALSRPTYPAELFQFLASLVERRKLAWDCATGNGQAAVLLAEYFDQVVASDASKKQIDNAQAHPKVRFAEFPAENATGLLAGTVDLVTVAQALHWFRLGDFYKEVRRVVRKDAVIAAWAYGLHSVSPEVDRVTRVFYHDIVGRYWAPEIRHVENRYQDIFFPFSQISTPQFEIVLNWDLFDLIRYLYTWSSTQKYMEQNNGSDPVKTVYSDLSAAWGKRNLRKKITFPIYMKAGRT
jgi:hypothetical protein